MVIMGIIMMIISLIMITITITITTARIIIIITTTLKTPATYHRCMKSNKAMRHNKSSKIIRIKTKSLITITLTK